ncbi:sigma-70 family RNA polymerase sigma factor [Halosquirtibacter laminarini]|uniref:Sigma-70 family RNA polymerase sigma factor n=1 Tax=Halosquirtibacter laminarini TaxID=3374600 RepID=A0AC61NF52_9BACT|nr:sigma-70 family RNA polymerase sigma factor [Prolixibacteraceae bacterium]
MKPYNTKCRPIEHMDDKTLIKQIKKGNTHAFEFLVRKYQRLVFHMLYKMGFTQEVVEDLAQEVFIKLYEKIDSFRNESKISTWVASITWRHGIDYKRKKRPMVSPSEDLSSYENLTPSNEEILANLYKEEKQQMVQDAIKKLPYDSQCLINLFYNEEFSYEEISEITKKPLGSVKSMLNRARTRIKEIVSKKYRKELKEEQV